MDKLLVLGTVPTNVELIEKAKKRGVHTIVTDYLEPERSPAKLVSDEYWMINTSDIDALEKKCREERVTAVITGISENNLAFMAQLCERLGLPCWCTPKSWDAIQKKDQFKQLCRENGVPVAKDYFLSNPPTEEELDGIEFPVVVKPVDLNSSKGVCFCNTREEVVKACEYARSLSKTDVLIVEQLVKGEFTMGQFLLADGEVKLIAAIGGLMTKHPGNAYVTLTTPAMKRLYEEQILPPLRKLLKQAGCREGICTVQSIIDANDRLYALEMGYRNSGDQMLYALRSAFGIDTLDWLLDIALGVQHRPKDLPCIDEEYEKKYACKCTLFSACEGVIHRIEGLDTFRSIPGILTWVDAAEGKPVKKVSPLIRATFVAESADQVCEMVEKINHSVQVYNEDGKDMMSHFRDFEGLRDMLSKQ